MPAQGRPWCHGQDETRVEVKGSCDPRISMEGVIVRALRWHGPRDLRVEDVPAPIPGEGEVLLRVLRTGICGTDLEEYLEGPVNLDLGRLPVTLGHEILAEIVRDGDAGLPAGTMVVPDVVVGCGRCSACGHHEPGLCPDLVVLGLQRDGGLAELMVADASSLVVVPDHVPADVAAFAEPLSVAVRALRKAGDLAGRRVCVVGAGTIGQLVIRSVRGQGAAVISAIDPMEARRELATDGGASSAYRPEEVDSSGLVADVVVECSGTPGAVRTAFDVVAPGGVVVLVGTGPEDVEFPVRRVVLNEIRVVGSAAHVWDVDVAAAVAMLAAGVVDPRSLISACVALEDAVDLGFERLASDRSALKILIKP